MESKKEEEKIVPKHEKLDEGKTSKTEDQEVEITQSKYIPNIASPFLVKTTNWTDESLNIPETIVQNIEDDLKFLNPSRIQSVAIPMILNGKNLIAQAKNGTGKTGAFSIGSVLRIDPKDKSTQVIVIVNSRELCNQIHEYYVKLVKNTPITLQNYCYDIPKDEAPANIIIGTHGKMEAALKGRKPLNLKGLKCLIVDEADVFFIDEKNFTSLKAISNYKDIKQRTEENKVQWILFSATYPTEDGTGLYDKVQQRQAELVGSAQQIKIVASKLKLDHIHQYTYQIPEGMQKIDFLEQIFDEMEATQSFVFVNTKNFAERVHMMLKKKGKPSNIMFGKMDKQERDETMASFRKQEIHTLICTDMIARGVDVPEAELVINLDIPTKQKIGSNNRNEKQGDQETYLHRIGRTGRFGKQGLALSIYNRDQDKEHLDEIIKHYDMGSMVQKLDDAEHLKKLLRDIADQ